MRVCYESWVEDSPSGWDAGLAEEETNASRIRRGFSNVI